MMGRALERFLRDHARPEIRVVSCIRATYDAALVIPVRDESPELVEGLRAACRDAKVLAILVVNGRRDDSGAVHAANLACMHRLASTGPAQDVAEDVRWVRAGTPDLLLVDRASPPFRFDPRDGVGLARRIGSDMVAAMWARGRLRSPWIHGTDADAVLGREHFTGRHSDAVALVHPYWHERGGDPLLDEVVSLYEIGLRWYVVGLAAAGSPWAFPTIGSCISVHVDAYAATRGMPCRQAGEDFYLLAKVAKLGPVERPRVPPIRLASRRSARVPFGTGPGVDRLLAARARGRPALVYHAETFAYIGRTIAQLEALAEDPAAVLEPGDGSLAGAWEALGVHRGTTAAIRAATTGANRRRRLHEWLDAFRTLKLVHALRDGGLPPMPWAEALASLRRTEDLAELARRGDLETVREALAEREPRRAGMPAFRRLGRGS